jgi:hypothetical protein
MKRCSTKQSPIQRRALALCILLLAFTAFSAAQDIASFEKRITVKTLPNGLTLLVCERTEARSGAS